MPDYVLKYADGRGQIHNQVASASSEKELREKYAQQGFLIYSLKTRSSGATTFLGGKKLNLEKFLIFNQQFVTLIRAGQNFVIPLVRLSPESQALARQIAGGAAKK